MFLLFARWPSRERVEIFFNFYTPEMTANKGALLKRRLIKANRVNKPVPAWKRLIPGNKQHYNAKRRHFLRTKLKYHE